jgi:AAA domain
MKEGVIMTFSIRQAEKVRQWARVCLWGTPKSGKTHTALMLATTLAGIDGKVGVISSEYGSSKLLSRKFPHDIIDLAEPDSYGNASKNPFSPQHYEEALHMFLKAGYKAIVIDSLSHSWAGEGGVLEVVDGAGKNSFSDGWSKGTPMYNHLVGSILGARCHIIVTLRAKDAYVMEEYTKRDGSRGTTPKNVGQAPVMRKGFGFEMQLTIRMDSLTAHLEASGVEEYIHKGEEIERPGPELAHRLLEAIDGAEPPVYAPAHTVEDVKAYFLSVFKDEARWEPFKVHTIGFNVPDDGLSDSELAKLHDGVEQAVAEIEKRKSAKATQQPEQQPQPETPATPIAQVDGSSTPATEQQLASLRKLRQHLGKPEPEDIGTMSYLDAKTTIIALSAEYNESRKQKAS